tara:strand:+ start:1935 stop:2900 length:966 start_codon:yes stop_codon:yes gene_type:complete
LNLEFITQGYYLSIIFEKFIEFIMTEKTLVIGGSGLLGHYLKQNLPDSDTYFTYNENKLNSEQTTFLDITNEHNLEKIFETVKPDVVFHTAAITNLDWCENNERKTFAVNTNPINNIVALAKTYNSKLIFVSTDSVFDGIDGNYVENDPLNPINIYSKSKIEAEKIVKNLDDSLIIRGTFFGIKKNKESFLSYLLKQLKNGKKIKVPEDKKSNGLFVNDFAKTLIEMNHKKLSGLFHIGSSDNINNFEFAKEIANIFGYEEDLIQNSLFQDIFHEKNLVAKRPLNTTLNVNKISNIIKMPNVKQVINSFYENTKQNYDFFY